LNIVIYLVFETGLLHNSPAAFIQAFSVRPSDIAQKSWFLHTAAPHFKLITYMFAHAGIFHLMGNMIFLFVFGDNVEDAMGHTRFILFYLMCGVFAAVIHSLLTASPHVPLVGASGAVSGVIGAYLMLHPNIRVWVLLPVPVLPFVPLRFSAGFVIGVWILYQIASALFLPASSTAFWAHVGGFAAGILLVLFMRRPGVPLLDKATGV
jgi:membrane associated rhomboid family serine protease